MKKRYGICNQEGEVVNVVVIKDGDDYQQPEGHTMHEDPEDRVSIGDRIENGEFQTQERLKEQPIPEPTVEQKRQMEYPKMEDQLDALWKELNKRRDGGETLAPEADDMLENILDVKRRNPKREGNGN